MPDAPVKKPEPGKSINITIKIAGYAVTCPHCGAIEGQPMPEFSPVLSLSQYKCPACNKVTNLSPPLKIPLSKRRYL